MFGETMNLEKLKEEQKRLSRKLELVDSFSEINTVAGCEIEYTAEEIIAAVVVLDYRTMTVIERMSCVTKPKVSFIPSFQDYRELPPIVEAFSMLRNKPDLVFYPGDGILHPRKMGCASHLGLLIDTPTIGVAKKGNFGTIEEGFVYVETDKRAVVINTKDYAKPLFVSPGHKITLNTSVKIFNECLREGKKLPEPLRVAHKFASFVKKTHKPSNPQHNPISQPSSSSAGSSTANPTMPNLTM
jgi:deoxyribonuclease V